MGHAIPLIEPSPAPEIFCSGLARVDAIGGGCAEFVLYRNARLDDGTIERHVVARIIAPLEAIPEAVTLMLGAIGRAVVKTASDPIEGVIH